MRIKKIILIVCMCIPAMANAMEYDGEAAIGWNGVTLKTNDSTVVDAEFMFKVPHYIVNVGTHFSHTRDNENVIGAIFALEKFNFLLEETIDYNWTTEDITSELKGQYSISPIDTAVFVTGKFRLDEFDYTGTDVGLEYTLVLNKYLAFGAKWTVPYDTDLNQLETIALLNVKVTLD